MSNILKGVATTPMPFDGNRDEPVNFGSRSRSGPLHKFEEWAAEYKAGKSILDTVDTNSHYIHILPIYPEDHEVVTIDDREYFKLRGVGLGNTQIKSPTLTGTGFRATDCSRGGCWYDGFAYVHFYNRGRDSWAVGGHMWCAAAKVGDLIDHAEKHGIPTDLSEKTGDRESFVLLGAQTCLSTPFKVADDFCSRHKISSGLGPGGYGHFYSPHVTPEHPTSFFSKLDLRKGAKSDLLKTRKLINTDDMSLAEIMAMKEKNK